MPKPSTRRALLAWSSGKDSAWCLHLCRQRNDVDVVALFSTLDEASNRLGMHQVRRELVVRQAAAAGLPWWIVELPSRCPNAVYEERLESLWSRAREEGIDTVVFGDLFLSDIRAYREAQLTGTGLEPAFPLWGRETGRLAREMIRGGLEATVVSVDRTRLGTELVGRQFDDSLLRDLPNEVDACGERGEFHTFVSGGPMFARPVEFVNGERRSDDELAWLDLLPGDPS